ncbi:dephospho-CoA kinase [Pedobacter yulinensis]|uniref:Dephospho-CoA kinase n=1 Tax=Pedobacter yulinensis TaxID=2126353 RepID=A0A2T3HHM9_9SPHI|nr:dephospho-CoA kinase [Pedobacter yulinensis]PST81944.1 dephospho-CoA kinase [Pedobacter yulinensis]
MLKVGVTGGIGSGKTTVCRIFEVLGVPVFYADAQAKSLMTSDPLLIAGLRNAFGAESYDASGALNSKHIAGIVFNSEAELARLNALVHPAVFRAFESWVAKVDPQVPYVLKEAALLFESGSYRLCDRNILVTAPLEVRIARVMARDLSTRDAVLARIARQLDDASKEKLADFVIRNEEDTPLIAQVMELHGKFIQMAT